MIAHVNDIDLYYEKSGEGLPLILVHGNGEDHTIFDEAVELLKQSFTCYCLDSRSHGKSSKVDVLHYQDMADDVVAFIKDQDLRDVVFYGFSDGGIIGLLSSAACDRISTLIVSGANITPDGVKPSLKLLFKVIRFFTKDPKIDLMLNEPHISNEMLGSIKARTLVLAGSKDLVVETETRHIAAKIPGAELRILEGEGHGSYIVHKTKIGEIIRDFVSG
ncbi:MAG: alpha/beta hydrolase [Oscillospiraceae bacterium]|nr:alpha/beta hydrolase [Oscillospiraceae bacterium]